MELGKFDWDLERTGNVTAIFGNETENEEIVLSYNISLRTALVQIFTDDCSTPVTLDVISTYMKTDITSPTHGQLDVTLDVNQNSVVASNIWRDGNTTGEAFIDLCVRVDLVLDDADQTSVHFHEQKLYLAIDLSRGFQVTDINLDREDADVDQQDVSLGALLTACQCNLDAECVSDVLVQGDDVYVCVFSDPETDFVISAVEQLEFSQDTLRITAIDNSTEDALTEVLTVGKTAIIRTQMRSDFFISSSPDDVIASGSVSLIFGDAGRSLRITPALGGASAPDRRRAKQTGEDENGFQVSMTIGRELSTVAASSDDDDSSGTGKVGIIIGSMVGFVGIALVAAALVMRKKKQSSALQEVEALAPGEIA